MENLSKKIGYLKGMLDGMAPDSDDGNGKLLGGMLELLEALTDRVEALDELVEDLNDYVASIDDDLAELEGGDGDDDFHFMDDEDDEDFEDDFDRSEDHLHLLSSAEDDEDDEDDEDEAPPLAAKMCPECHHMFFSAMDDGEDAEYLCPSCGQRIRPMPLTPENAPILRPVED